MPRDPRVFARLYQGWHVAFRELIVHHPPEPTTTLIRNMEDEQGVHTTHARKI